MWRIPTLIGTWVLVWWWLGTWTRRVAAQRTADVVAIRALAARRDLPTVDDAIDVEPSAPSVALVGPDRCGECPAFGCGACHRTTLGFCPGCGLAQGLGSAGKHTGWCVVRRLDASDRLMDLFAVVGPLSDDPPGVLMRRDLDLTIEEWARLTDRLRDTPGFWAVHLGDGAQVVPYLDYERPDLPDPL